MREIKFRGKRTDNGKWVEGCLTRYSGNISYITVDFLEREIHEVHTNTVGQYTGLKDKNRKEVYEGDIVRTKLGDVQEIRFISQDFEDGVVRTFVSLSRKPPHLMAMTNSDEIIGNIHENPELLGVQVDDH